MANPKLATTDYVDSEVITKQDYFADIIHPTSNKSVELDLKDQDGNTVGQVVINPDGSMTFSGNLKIGVIESIDGDLEVDAETHITEGKTLYATAIDMQYGGTNKGIIQGLADITPTSNGDCAVNKNSLDTKQDVIGTIEGIDIQTLTSPKKGLIIKFTGTPTDDFKYSKYYALSSNKLTTDKLIFGLNIFPVGVEGGRDANGVYLQFSNPSNIAVGLRNVLAPVNGTDAANKDYVDDIVGNIDTILGTMANDASISPQSEGGK